MTVGVRWGWTVAVLLTCTGCARVRAVIGLDEPASGPVPATFPTERFLGLDRLMSAPGPDDGSFERVVFPDSTASRQLPAGDSVILLDRAGPGVIRRIRLALASTDPDYLRRVAVRMYWDGETQPSVDVPLGDFFANAFELRPYASLGTGVAGDAFYSYLPMPFAGSARIVLENGAEAALDGLDFEADVEVELKLEPPVATFHAAWTRESRPRADRPHVAADIRGAGWFVGTSLSAQGFDSTFAFLRGEGRFRIDGRALPESSAAAYLGESVRASGGTVSGPFVGEVLRDETRGRLSAYRWHLTDPIPFRSTLRLELTRGRANREAAEYATVAYWYQTEPHEPLAPLPYASERKIAEVIIPADAQHRDDLALIGTGEGTLRLTVRAPRDDRYEVVIYPEASPGAVAPTVSVRGRPGAGRALDVSPPGAEPGDVLPGVVVDTVPVTSPSLDLELTARGGGIALPAAVHLNPVRRWAEDWSVVGAWPDPALDVIHGPETEPALDRRYPLTGSREVGWEPARAERGVLRLDALFPATARGVAYAQTFVWSPGDRVATLILSADAPHVLWVNGERIAELAGPRPLPGLEIEIPVFLRSGWNPVMFKAARSGDDWSLALRAADPTGELSWAGRPAG